jgi:hypothetical protein
MDTAAPHIKLCTAKGARRRVMSTDRTASDQALTRTIARCLANSLDILTEREPAALVTVRARHLPVTESSRSRHSKAVSMPNIQKFDVRALLVPPILLPLLFGLVVAGAVIVQW